VKYIVAIAGREVEVEVDGEQVTVAGRVVTAGLAAIAGTPLRQLNLNGRVDALGIERQGSGRWAVTRLGERHEIEVLDERARHIRSLTGGGDRPRGPTVLKAPMPGLVVRVQVEPGQAVAPGTGLVVLEAMKMENELRAAVAGVVRAVRVAPGAAVEKGEVLVEFDPSP
jgi:biotin carboxyl carrier protein